MKSGPTFDGEKWHNRPITSLSRLLRVMTSNRHGDFYFLNCIYSFSTDDKLKNHEELCDKHDHCCIEMPKEGKKY